MSNTFSIVLETANLAINDLAQLKSALDTLYNQTLSVSNAKEVIVVDTGLVPIQEIQDVCRQYANIQIVRAQTNLDYYLTKAEGFKYTTADIVAFVDSDCTINSEWLESILQPFDNPQIQIVTGETWHQIRTPYDLSVGLLWTLRPFTYGKQITEVASYYANNLAVRRQVLLEIPFVGSGENYRTGQSEHAHRLRQRNVQIWSQPRARAYHQVPKLKYIFKILFSNGRDTWLLSKQGKNTLGTKGLWGIRISHFLSKFFKIMFSDWKHPFYMILSAPMSILLFLSYIYGYLYGRIKSKNTLI